MEQFADNSKKKKQNRIKNILEAFEHIVDMAKDTNLGPEFFENASVYIRYASRKLALSSM